MRYYYAYRKDGSRTLKSAYRSNLMPWYQLKPEDMDIVKKSRSVGYYTEAAAFDIETTSYVDSNATNKGFMYMWQFYIRGISVYGRTWQEWCDFLVLLSAHLSLNEGLRLIIYVHNLGYEFQFMRKFLERLGGIEVFATKPRRPLSVRSTMGFEFRCSYYLSNMSLYYATTSEYGCEYIKALGDLDFRIFRSVDTYLDMAEFSYAMGDVISLGCYIKAKLKNNHDSLVTIPLTSTGYVRRKCRKACKADDTHMKMFFKCALTPNVYKLAKQTARGGDTAANYRYSTHTIADVDSYDVQSSYPYVLCTKKFPVTRFYPYKGSATERQIDQLIKKGYAVLFRVMFSEIHLNYEAVDIYLPLGKAESISDNHLNVNGRISYAAECVYVLTDIDWKIIKDNYHWDSCACESVYTAEYGYLPKVLRQEIMSFYHDKSMLKWKVEHYQESMEEPLELLEYLYMKSKNGLNGIFGMMYTDPVRDSILYQTSSDEVWKKEKGDVKKELSKFMKHNNSFLVYLWGVWTTARAREHLQGLLKLTGEGTVYWDTDSSKAFNVDESLIEEANRRIRQECESMDVPAYTEINGESFYMGLYEKETKKGKYQLFKTLGAKKYAYVDHEGELHLTVSGVAKSKHPLLPNGAREMKSLSNFKYGFKFTESAGLEMTYNDEEIHQEKLPNGDVILSASNIGSKDGTYTIGITEEYAQCLGINFYEI